MLNNNYNLLLNKLDEFIRKYYANQLIRGSILFISAFLALFLFAVLAEYFGQFNARIRTIFFYSLALILVFLFAWLLLKPLLKLIAIGKRISHEKAANIIGKYFQEIDDKLFNVLQLKESTSKVSSNLIEASINQKIQNLQPIPFTLAINFKENKRYLKYFIIPTLIIVGLAAFEPKIISDSTNRLVDFSSEYIPKAPYEITIENKNLNAYKNEDFVLKVKLSGEEIPNSFYIIFSKERFLMKKTDATHFTYTFRNVAESLDFSFFDGEFESKNYALNLLPKPLLRDVGIRLNYPAYLKRKNEQIENSGDLIIPEGTEVTWKFNTENTRNLVFIGKDSSENILQSGENEFTYSNRFYKSFSYGLSTANEHLNFEDTVFYSLTVIPDLHPNIEVETSTDSTNKKLLYFKGVVKDDYGFSKLVFHQKFIGEKDSIGEAKSEIIPINKSLPQTVFYHAWNTNQFQLKAGDQIEYYFEIWDNDGVNGSKSSRTKKMFYKAPTLNELAEKSKENSESVKKELKESIALTQEIKKDLEALKEKLVDKKQMGFQEKKQLETLLKKQQQIKETLKNLEEKNKENNQLQEEYNPLDEEILEKQKMLQDMFEKVMTDEMKKMMEELEKMMEKMQKDQLQESIEKIELSNDEMLKEMDRNMELFKQLEIEKDLAETKKKLDDLKEKQKELKEKSEDKKTDTEDLKEEQDELNKEFEEISEKLDEIQEKNKELEQPNKLEDTKSLEDQIKKDMKESSDELSKKNKQKASENQGDSEEKMEELSEQLSEMQLQMEAEANAENLEDLRALLENLIRLSFDQEELMTQLKSTNINDPNYVKLAQQQKKIKDDAKMIEDSLFALSKRVIQIQNIVNKEIADVNYNMKKAIDELQERRTAIANSRQQLSMTSINNLALLLDEAIQNMQAQMQMMSGKEKCKKPGSGSPSPGSMKSLQKSLNEQMKSLKESMEKGKSPGKGKEGEQGLMGSGMSKQLAQMAAKQAAIREAVKQLQEQIGDDKKGNGDGGSLQKLQEMMEETETELVNKQITNQTILRQQEILTRLLQSEKAEREREKDEKRESIEFRNELSRNQKQFIEYNKLKEKELELLKTVPPSFNIFYKNKVTEYFNQLEK